MGSWLSVRIRKFGRGFNFQFGIQRMEIDFRHNIFKYRPMDVRFIQDPVRVKAQEQPEVHKCLECSKTFTKINDLELHAKNKHSAAAEKQNVSRSKPNKSQPRNRVLEMQQNEHEDTIYAYLGELGEKNQESGSREDAILTDEAQKTVIQTNYSFNKVVRTPYEKQICPSELIPLNYVEGSQDKEFLETLMKELREFQEKLDLEKQKWEFRDPMAPQEIAEDEFSLMEVRKLILNYPRRNIVAKYPHFAIFILWVGRICKPPAWKQFFIIVSSYLSEYYKKERTGRPPTKWENYNKQFQAEPVSGELMSKLNICDERTVKKLCEYFCKWTQLFDLVNQFC